MEIEQLVIPENDFDLPSLQGDSPFDAHLVLVFGEPEVISQPELLESLRQRYTTADIVFCSSGGQIAGTQVVEDAAVITAIHFDSVTTKVVTDALTSADDSENAALRLSSMLSGESLRHVVIFSEGLHVNGSAVSAGFSKGLPKNVAVTGGLAADGSNFKRTLVGANEIPRENQIVAIGFYGDALEVGMGSMGGWEMFGPDRRITRSEGNVLYELDGRRALDVYREVVGLKAYGLPATGLLFPINIRVNAEDAGLVRTLLGIDDETGSVTFAGDVPQGRYARMMRADLDTLVDAAGAAAGRAGSLAGAKPELALLVSCIGRKLALQTRTKEEVSAAAAHFGPDAVLAGFYSYGEISPLTPGVACEMHNQTMTITTLSES